MNTPKFKKGDWIKSINSGRTVRVVMLLRTCYSIRLSNDDSYFLDYSYQDNWELTDAPPKNKLEEAAGDAINEYCPEGVSTTEGLVFTKSAMIGMFKDGAEWQASQIPMPGDTVLFNKGVEEGRRLEREDIMKDAADIKITRDTLYTLKPFILEKYLEYKIGKTAKLLLIQEDEK